MLKQKILAMSCHFLFSLVLMTVCGCLVFFIWYPFPFNEFFQVEKVFYLLLAIDLVLGPLMTFIIYKKGKKTLKFDLSTILVIQLLALGWGMWSIAQARPAWLVLVKDSIYAVSPSMLKDANDKQYLMPWYEQNWSRPKLVSVNPTQQKRNETSIVLRPNFYDSYNKIDGAKNKLSLSKIKDYNEELYQEIMRDYPQAEGYFPIFSDATIKVAIALIDKDGKLIKIIYGEGKHHIKIPVKIVRQ